jgi:hypothetical protein
MAAKFIEVIKDYKWIAGVLSVMVGSWYDLRGEVKDVKHSVEQNQAVQDVKNSRQELRDAIQDRRLDDLQDDLKQELKSINRKLEYGNRKPQ